MSTEGGWQDLEAALRDAKADPERRDALSLDVIVGALRFAASQSPSENHARAYGRALSALTGRRHTVHYRWPVLCGQFSASAGDTWSGNSGDVTCPDCLSRRECPKPIACASGPLVHIETPDCGPDRT